MGSSRAEREHKARVAELGCIICRRPAAVHHINVEGIGRRATDYETIPLCGDHHQNGGYGVAVHAGRVAFEAAYGTERELLALAMGELGIVAGEAA